MGRMKGLLFRRIMKPINTTNNDGFRKKNALPILRKIVINYHAYKTWFEFDLKGRPQQNPSRGLAEIR